MRVEEVNSLLQSIANLERKVSDAAGAAILVELRMRLIAELCKPVRVKLEELIKEKEKQSGKKIRDDKYWNCNLSFLEKAIQAVFSDNPDSIQLTGLKKTRDLRNALLHANFVEMMKLLRIPPEGRQIDSWGSKNKLEEAEIREAIISIDRSQGLGEFEKLAKEVAAILDRLIFSSAK